MEMLYLVFAAILLFCYLYICNAEKKKKRQYSERHQQHSQTQQTILTLIKAEKEDIKKQKELVAVPYLETRLDALYYQLDLLQELSGRYEKYDVASLTDKELKQLINTTKNINALQKQISDIEIQLERTRV